MGDSLQQFGDKAKVRIHAFNKKFETLIEDGQFQIMSGILIFYILTTITLVWCLWRLVNNFRIYKPKLRLEYNYILYFLCFFDAIDLFLGTLHQVLIHVYSRSDEDQCQWFGLAMNVSHNYHVLLSLIYQYYFFRSIKNPTISNIFLDIVMNLVLFALTIVFNYNSTQMLC